MRASHQAKAAEARLCTEAMRDLFQGFRARFVEELRGTGVTLPQLRMLKIIEQQPEESAAAIARLCHVTPQTLHTMLTRAVREGWIVRGSSDRNHRVVTATLTPAGAAIVRQGMDLRERLEAELWRDVSVEALRSFRQMLESGVANLGRRSEASGKDRAHPSP
jgi:MarR family transcriptional regulator, organic hydroperoxide resistance regulator